MSLPDEDRRPALNKDSFDCPACGAFAHQPDHELYLGDTDPEKNTVEPLDDEWFCTVCASCNSPAFWHHNKLVWPTIFPSGPPPHSEMPPAVAQLYDEARGVATVSSRATAALLRLALQVLVDELLPGNGRIDDKIGRLVKQGLDPQIQKAMDVIRVIGNNAVHPGVMDLEAQENLAPALFELINVIVEQIIARPKHIAALFSALPEGARAAIARRDDAERGTAPSGSSPAPSVTP